MWVGVGGHGQLAACNLAIVQVEASISEVIETIFVSVRFDIEDKRLGGGWREEEVRDGGKEGGREGTREGRMEK